MSSSKNISFILKNVWPVNSESDPAWCCGPIRKTSNSLATSCKQIIVKCIFAYTWVLNNLHLSKCSVIIIKYLSKKASSKHLLNKQYLMCVFQSQFWNSHTNTVLLEVSKPQHTLPSNMSEVDYFWLETRIIMKIEYHPYSILPHNSCMISMGMKQKSLEFWIFPNAPILNIFQPKFQGLVLWF